MKKRFGTTCALLAAGAMVLMAATSVSAGEGSIQVLGSIPFDSESNASQKVKDGCELETKVPEFLDSYSDKVELVGELDKTKGRVLELTVSKVHAPGGGAFSGAKSMSVSGVLLENGKKIGSFEAKRFSSGGAFGGYKGTCAIVGRCAKSIGKDISRWLENPGMDDRLGDS
jgi:hypothetical protein